MTLRFRLVGAVVFVFVATAVLAQLNPTPCSLATLNGSYGRWEQGTIVETVSLPPAPVAPFPVMLVGIVNYDGAGNFLATVKQSFAGFIQPRTYSGTYEVTPDCKYTQHFVAGGNQIISSGLITGSGIFQQIDFVYVNAPRPVVGTIKKMPPGGCSVLSGRYEVFGQGSLCSYTPGAPDPPICTQVAHVGPFTLQANGDFSGSEVVHVGNTDAGSDTFTGIATLSADCTFSLTITNSSDLVINEWGVVTGEGRSQEMHAIVTNPGWVLIENIKKQ